MPSRKGAGRSWNCSGSRPAEARDRHPILIGELPFTPPHMTSTRPVPGRVSVPIVHDQDAVPLASVVFDTRPAALLFVPAGVKYAIVHCAFGGPPTEADA